MNFVYRSVISLAKMMFKYWDNDITLLSKQDFPAEGGVILASNHIGFLDFVYAAYFPWESAHRYTRFMTKNEAYKNPIAGWLLRKMRHIPVDRGNAIKSMETALEYLSKGEVVGIFPEGTISRAYELREFKTGVGRLALEANVPIVPVAVWGTQRLMTKGHPKDLGRSHIPIVISAGEPLEPVGTPEELTEKTKKAINELLHQSQELYPQPQGAWWLPQRLGGGAPTLELVAQEDAAKKATKKG